MADRESLRWSALKPACRASLTSLQCYLDSTYKVERAHRFIARKLERLNRGEITRLIITMPPGHGKSRLVAQDFPAWRLGLDPRSKIAMISYHDELAEKSSYSCRSRFDESKYRFHIPGSVMLTSGNRTGNL